MIFCPNGSSSVLNITSDTSPQTFSLSGIDSEVGVLRTEVQGAGLITINFGLGAIQLQEGLVEFFRPAHSVTSVTINNTTESSTNVSLTIGQMT